MVSLLIFLTRSHFSLSRQIIPAEISGSLLTQVSSAWRSTCVSVVVVCCCADKSSCAARACSCTSGNKLFFLSSHLSLSLSLSLIKILWNALLPWQQCECITEIILSDKNSDYPSLSLSQWEHSLEITEITLSANGDILLWLKSNKSTISSLKCQKGSQHLKMYSHLILNCKISIRVQD